MSMSGAVRAAIAFLVSIVMMYILSITFGGAMDTLYVQFYDLLHTLPLSAGWQTVGLSTLDGWKWFYRSFIVAVIAVGVWFASAIFVDVDYGRSLK